MCAAILALLALAAPPAKAPPDAAWVDTCDLVRFRVPRGFEHIAATEGGVRKHAARSSDAVVSVGAAEAPGGLDCVSAAAREAGLAPAKLARGGVACEVAKGDPEGNGAMAVVMVELPENRAAAVVGFARKVEQARAAARAVAETVVPSRGPRPDPRLLGCFGYSVSVSAGSSSAGGNTVRCFRGDGSLGQRVDVDVFTSGSSARTTGHGDGSEEGSWCLDGDVLTLDFADGGQAREVIELAERGLIAGSRVWIRQGD